MRCYRILSFKFPIIKRKDQRVSCLAKDPGGGGVLPYKRLIGMCRWMGSHFHDWIDYNGVTFLVEYCCFNI